MYSIHFIGANGMMHVVSFDVWNTILNLQEFYYEIARHISELTGKDFSEVIEKIGEAYKKAKEARRQGKFNEVTIVNESLKLASEIIGVPEDILKRSMARATYTIDPKKAIIPGVEIVLSELKSEGVSIAILGNVLFWPGAYTRIIMERTGLATFIDKQFYADEIGVSKPNPRAFKIVMDYFKIREPSQMAHVGDSFYEDFGGAINARIIGILIDKGVNEPISFGENQGHVIPDIKFVPEVISRV